MIKHNLGYAEWQSITAPHPLEQLEANTAINTTWRERAAPWVVVVVFIAASFALLWDVLFNAAQSVINQPGNTNSIFAKVLGHASGIASLVVLAALFVFRYKELHWRKIDPDGLLKWVLFVCAALIVWILAFENYNYFLNNWFVADRVLLVVLGVAIIFHPVFLPLFLVFSVIFFSQYFAPFSWPYVYDIKPLFNTLLAGSCVALIGFRGVKAKHVFTMMLLAQMGTYFVSGIGKIYISPQGINWVTDNELFLLPLNTHLRGWMSGASNTYYEHLTTFFKKFGVLISAIILLAELACALVLTNRKVAIGLFIAMIIMHVGIALTTGIIFWIWVVLDSLFIAVLVYKPSYLVSFQGRWGWLKSGVLIGVAVLLFRPLYYAWFDSRYQWITEIEVIDDQGQQYSFSKNNFGGYSYLFAHDALGRAINYPMPGRNGYCGNLSETKLYEHATVQNIDSLRAINAKNHYDQAWAGTLTNFIATYFSNYNKAIGASIHLPAAPKQLYMYHSALPILPNGQKVAHCKIIEKEYLYTGDKYHCLKNEAILDIDVTRR